LIHAGLGGSCSTSVTVKPDEAFVKVEANYHRSMIPNPYCAILTAYYLGFVTSDCSLLTHVTCPPFKGVMMIWRITVYATVDVVDEVALGLATGLTLVHFIPHFLYTA